MYLLSYNFPETFKQSLRRIADVLNCVLREIGEINELNEINLSDYEFVLIYGCNQLSRHKIHLKVGNRNKVVCFSDPSSMCDDIPDIHRLIPVNVDNLDAFVTDALLVLRDKSMINEEEQYVNFNSRLELIHQLTQKALHSISPEEIQEFMLKKLVEYYDAVSCTQLIYDETGDLYFLARAKSDGSFQNNIFEKVENKQDYEECTNCGQPIINCRTYSESVENYFCAPITNNGKITGLIRITYRSRTVDLEVDKVILSIAADILAASNIRNQTLRALSESELKTRAILETTVDAIITITERGLIETFNQAAEKLFGYDSEEVKGKNIKILMPDPYVNEHDEYLERYQKTGERQIIGVGREVVGKRKDGSLFPMYLAVSELNLEGRKTYTGIVRDITEERRLEKEVMRISEHERHRIGQDLHDGLGQMLSGIGLLSRHMVKKLESESNPVSVEMEEIANLVKEADDFSRNLAHGLVKINLERGGFNAALEDLVRQSVRLFRITCEFKANKEINTPLLNTSIELFKKE